MKINPLLFVPALALVGLAARLPADPPAQPAQPGLAAPNAADGQVAFQQRCGTCHATQADQPSALGPNLANVVGRPAAAAEFRYTAALRASGLTWTRENLDAYLAAPTKLVPGTRMVVGIPDVAQRAAVLDYLASISPTPVPTTVVPPAGAGEHSQHTGH